MSENTVRIVRDILVARGIDDCAADAAAPVIVEHIKNSDEAVLVTDEGAWYELVVAVALNHSR